MSSKQFSCIKKINLVGKTAFCIAIAVLMIGGLKVNTALGQEPSLLIWINSDKGFKGLSKVAAEYEKLSGVKVKVEHPEGPHQKFQTLAAAGKGPDIIFWAHDLLGVWKSAGIIAPVNPSASVKSKILPEAWHAFTSDDAIWGYPVSLEVVALLYNKKLIKSPPKTFEEIPNLDAKLKQEKNVGAITWFYNASYYSWGLIGANGGYAFKEISPGTYDPNDIGLGNAGAIKGLNMLLSLVKKGGVMPPDLTYQGAETAFIEGRSAMHISGPWVWKNAAKNGIDLGLAEIPSVKGKPAAPWYGVGGGYVSAASKNKELAVDFLETYTTSPKLLKLVNDDIAIGVPANIAFYNQLKGDENIKNSLAGIKNGTPMPSNKEMSSFWEYEGKMLQAITSRKKPVKEAVGDAVKSILSSYKK